MWPNWRIQNPRAVKTLLQLLNIIKLFLTQLRKRSLRKSMNQRKLLQNNSSSAVLILIQLWYMITKWMISSRKKFLTKPKDLIRLMYEYRSVNVQCLLLLSLTDIPNTSTVCIDICLCTTCCTVSVFFDRTKKGEHDVWRNLTQNWDHFFWLSGETPQTLDILVRTVKGRFPLVTRKGRISCLTIHNQVFAEACSTKAYNDLFNFMSYLFLILYC